MASLSSKNMVSTTHFTTRLASVDDANTVLEIGTKTFLDTFAEYNTAEDMRLYMEKTFTLDQIKKDILDPSTTFILAYDGQSIVGYAKLREGNNPIELDEETGIEIERIYSLKDYIGKSVGKTLLQACIDIALQRRYKVIWLGVWEHNPRAIAFYEKWGFEKFGSHPFLLGNDLQTDLLMRKNIA
jgi:ribosomal protein S18 acetylase RimI-like enzyme